MYKAKEALISQGCPSTGWLDDVVSLQSEKRVSGRVTVDIGVTGIDISFTLTNAADGMVSNRQIAKLPVVDKCQI